MLPAQEVGAQIDLLVEEGWRPEDLALLTTGSRHPEQAERQKDGHSAYWDTFWDTDQVFYGRAGFLGYVAGNEQERSAVPHVDLPPEIIEMPTLIDVVAGRRGGRPTDVQTSFFLNVGAIGAQFEGVAAAVYHKAREQGLGREIPTEWFLQDIRD